MTSEHQKLWENAMAEIPWWWWCCLPHYRLQDLVMPNYHIFFSERIKHTQGPQFRLKFKLEFDQIRGFSVVASASNTRYLRYSAACSSVFFFFFFFLLFFLLLASKRPRYRAPKRVRPWVPKYVKSVPMHPRQQLADRSDELGIVMVHSGWMALYATLTGTFIHGRTPTPRYLLRGRGRMKGGSNEVSPCVRG